MTRAPQIEDRNLSRMLHRLRSQRHAQVDLVTGQKSPNPEAQNANRSKDRKTPAQVARKSAKPLVLKSQNKARTRIKSP